MEDQAECRDAVSWGAGKLCEESSHPNPEQAC